MEALSTERHDADRVIDVMAGTQVFRDAEAERAARLKAERGALVAQLRKLEKDAARDFPPIYAETDAAEHELQVARNANDRLAVVVASAKLSALLGKRYVMSANFDSAHDGLEAQLRATAAPSITVFLRELAEKTLCQQRNIPAPRPQRR